MKDFVELTTLDAASELCVFAYCGANLGDHIQTLALLQHVRPHRFVFRDAICPQKDLVLIANGWLTHGEIPRVGQFRGIRYAGVHLDTKLRTPENIDRLRSCGVIGCRDPVTMALLQSYGLPTALCLCATLTFSPYTGEREHIVCVDLTDKECSRVKAKFGRLGRVIRVSHHLPKCAPRDMTIDRMMTEMRQAHEFLQLYRRAKLVVTNRIHAALPCIAFETPVIVFKSFEDRASIFDSLQIREGSYQFRWFNMFPWPQRQLPQPLHSREWKDNYLNFLQHVVSEVATPADCRVPPAAVQRIETPVNMVDR